MLQIHPNIELTLECPLCSTQLIATDWVHTGMRIMIDCRCEQCKKGFFSELPVNSALFYPGTIDKATGKRVDKMPFDNWYLSGLESAYAKKDDGPVNIEIVENKKIGDKPVLLLNTIDATYGHALYELLNAGYYLLQTDFDLVIIVQRNLSWLVPKGPAQIWIADIPFGRAANWLNRMDGLVKKQLRLCKEIFICRSFVQADSTDFDIFEFTSVKPFPLDEWDKRMDRPVVTFIWRNDRFWRPVLPRLINNRVTQRIFPSLLVNLAKRIQFKWILKFAEELKAQIPSVDFAIAGMDEKKPKLPSWIRDLRFPTHEDETARLQLERYAASHVVLGCNGSSLLLPGCMAGAVIDIVPGDQWAVSAGTFPFRFTSIGDTHYRYILLPPEVTIRRVVSVLVSLLRDRSYVEIQTSHPWRDHTAKLGPYAWRDHRIDIFNTTKKFSSQKGLVTTSKSKKGK